VALELEQQRQLVQHQQFLILVHRQQLVLDTRVVTLLLEFHQVVVQEKLAQQVHKLVMQVVAVLLLAVAVQQEQQP
jgi:hypothetical protein